MSAFKSRTLATWLAFVGGSLGLHRFYLHGLRDGWGWLHWPPAALGLYGVLRMHELGQDDRWGSLLVPLLGLVLSASMLAAAVYGLTSDEQWNARFNPQGPASHGGWLVIFGVIGAVMVGATVLIATIAFSGQRYFEAQVQASEQAR